MDIQMNSNKLEIVYSCDQDIVIKSLKDQRKILIEIVPSINDQLGQVNYQINNLHLDSSDTINNLPDIIKEIQSESDTNKFYTCNLTKNTCTCSDFIYRKRICKHLKQFKDYSL